jgi:predicted aspartyl protease
MMLVSPFNGKRARLLFRLDTGADITAIPRHLVNALGLLPYRKRYVLDYNSRTSLAESYLVHFVFAGKTFSNIEVITTDGLHALLGLDILNQLTITHDGPRKLLAIH